MINLLTAATTIIAFSRLTSSRLEDGDLHLKIPTTTTTLATLLLNDHDATPVPSHHNLHALSLTQAQRASAKKA